MQRLRAREIILAGAFVLSACKRESVATTTATASIASAAPPASTIETEFGTSLNELQMEPVSVRVGDLHVTGALPPEVVARIIRQKNGAYRQCYREGLHDKPGRVTVRFVIDHDGSVKGAPQDGGSDLPDPSVVRCVVGAFANLSFPQPADGIVTVVAPLFFSAANDAGAPRGDIGTLGRGGYPGARPK